MLVLSRESALMVANHMHGKLENRHWYEHLDSDAHEVTSVRAGRRCNSCVRSSHELLSAGGSFVFAVKISRGEGESGCLLLVDSLVMSGKEGAP